MPDTGGCHLEVRRGQLRVDRVLVERRLAAALADRRLRPRRLHAAAPPGAAPPSGQRWAPATIGEALHEARCLVQSASLLGDCCCWRRVCCRHKASVQQDSLTFEAEEHSLQCVLSRYAHVSRP